MRHRANASDGECSELRRLVNVDDYRAAWRCTDAGKAWISYQDEFDYLCPAGLIAFDDDIWDGGVDNSVTEMHLMGFLFALQQQDRESPTFALPPVDVMAKSMLAHEPYVLDHQVAGPAWRHLKENRSILYAILMYALYRKEWKKVWVERACRVIHDLHDAAVPVAHLRSLRRVDPLLIERARDYKAAGGRLPRPLQSAHAAFQELAMDGSVTSAATRSLLEKELHAYEVFLAEYKRRRRQRFDAIADDDLRTAAGAHKDLLRDRRGEPSRDQLPKRVVKAVFISLTDELKEAHGMSMYKAATLAAQLNFFLFLDTQERSGIDPFKRGSTKRALNAYRYAKKSRPSV